jgi:hypothetical protein
VLRDADFHPLTKEVIAMQFQPRMAGYQQILGAGLAAKQQPMLQLALSFFTWRTLARESGLGPHDAAAAMIQAIDCAK